MTPIPAVLDSVAHALAPVFASVEPVLVTVAHVLGATPRFFLAVNYVFQPIPGPRV